MRSIYFLLFFVILFGLFLSPQVSSLLSCSNPDLYFCEGSCPASNVCPTLNQQGFKDFFYDYSYLYSACSVSETVECDASKECQSNYQCEDVSFFDPGSGCERSTCYDISVICAFSHGKYGVSTYGWWLTGNVPGENPNIAVGGGLNECNDGRDNDCDGLADCQDSGCADVPSCACIDNDGDGFGVDPGITADCTSLVPDCDDTNVDVYPGAPEICDGIDNQCVLDELGNIDPGFGQIDENCASLVSPRLVFNDVLGNPILAIDKLGTTKVYGGAGSLFENQGSITSDSNGDFLIKSGGVNLFKIDEQTSSIYMLGQLNSMKDTPLESYLTNGVDELIVMNSSGNVVVVFDSFGSLLVRGDVLF